MTNHNDLGVYVDFFGPNHDAVLNQPESKQQGHVPGGSVFGNHLQLPHVASSFSEEDRAK